jgi:hypothetical protein
MYCKEVGLKTSRSSAADAPGARQRSRRSFFALGCAAGLPLPDFWRQNQSWILPAVAALIVLAIVLWIVRRRRPDSFPEIKFDAPARALEKDITLMEGGRPEPPARSAFSPGIYGKIEVLVNDLPISTYLVTDNPLTIGRDPAQALAIIQEAIISKIHCSIFFRDGRVFIKDLHSTNGTYVNDVKVDEEVLQDGDVVSLGKKGTIKIIYHK